MSEAAEAKPCPVCGKEPAIGEWDGRKWATCKTLGCSLNGTYWLGLATWNWQPRVDSLLQRIVELEAQLAEFDVVSWVPEAMKRDL